ncbi:hypothetical protein NHB29_22530 (plasmid) [Pantoea agglomerans]|uniref:hypothetical protein n=1 Tax=Enterobacter agglomerans TaxID=549 RepID=UPI00273A6E85|nr:hypothetical protein [Pantoea agglomerans]WLO87197.1 hypothetical protein NHB29_22530 [Pantoea agglomerans]
MIECQEFIKFDSNAPGDYAMNVYSSLEKPEEGFLIISCYFINVYLYKNEINVYVRSGSLLERVASELAFSLPSGKYKLNKFPVSEDFRSFILGWCEGCYRSDDEKKHPTLIMWADKYDKETIHLIESIQYAKRLIQLPANLQTPTLLAEECKTLCELLGLEFEIIKVNSASKEFPLLASVGSGSGLPSYFFKAKYIGGDSDTKNVSLIGKGVVFDQGGANAKSKDGIRNMKRDMSGAAIVLALLKYVHNLKLKINLFVNIPICLNSFGPNALLPGDILMSENGKTIEISNTDGEGRLIIAEAITKSSTYKSDLLITIGSLTSGARNFIGPDFSAAFSNPASIAEELSKYSYSTGDPLISCPLWYLYKPFLKSSVADLVNSSEKLGMGSSMICALFLHEFVGDDINWLHIDAPGWNFVSEFGVRTGPSAKGLSAIAHYLTTLD